MLGLIIGQCEEIVECSSLNGISISLLWGLGNPVVEGVREYKSWIKGWSVVECCLPGRTRPSHPGVLSSCDYLHKACRNLVPSTFLHGGSPPRIHRELMIAGQGRDIVIWDVATSKLPILLQLTPTHIPVGKPWNSLSIYIYTHTLPKTHESRKRSAGKIHRSGKEENRVSWMVNQTTLFPGWRDGSVVSNTDYSSRIPEFYC